MVSRVQDRELQEWRGAVSTAMPSETIGFGSTSAWMVQIRWATKGRREGDLETDRAVVVHGAGDAAVVVAQLHGVAAAAVGAMEEVFASSDAADATAFTVEVTLAQGVIEEIADATEICAKAQPAACARALHWLLQ